MKFPQRTIQVNGYHVDMVNFGYASYYYPQVGDREFPVTAKGFRALSHFLRTVDRLHRMMEIMSEQLITEAGQPTTDIS